MDIQLLMHPVDPRRLLEKKPSESSESIAARVMRAREIQRERFEQEGIFCNAAMNGRMIEKYCPLDKEGSMLLEKLIGNMGLSARAYSRIVKLARTIADMEGRKDILAEHIAEAAGYRFLDKQRMEW